MAMIEVDQRSLMRRALDLARRGPTVDTNPRVGAVVVDGAGEIVGSGFHRGAGTPHAEVVALAAAGPRAQGGTLVVTLEPCNHTGRTGPCARSVIEAGIARVVFGQADPNPEAAGGAQTLRAAGIGIEAGLLADEAIELNRSWTVTAVRGRPWVVWKFAATLDGRSAATDGSSQWITGPRARADVHELRALAGAILVGTGTVLADDPALTVRTPDGRLRERQPLRVVLGRRPIPATARVRDDSAETLLIGRRDPAYVLRLLAERGIHHVWLEGGPTLAAAFLRAGLVDDVVAYLAPALLGGGRAAVGDLGISSLPDALRLQPYDVTVLGPDVRIRAAPARPHGSPVAPGSGGVPGEVAATTQRPEPGAPPAPGRARRRRHVPVRQPPSPVPSLALPSHPGPSHPGPSHPLTPAQELR